MNSTRSISGQKILVCCLIFSIVWLTGCSPEELPYIIINHSDAPAVVSYRLIDCQIYENYKWRQNYEPLKLGTENYFNAGNQPPFAPFAADEVSMVEKPSFFEVKDDSKRKVDCVERNYTVNLPAKTVLQVAHDDFSPKLKMDFLEIKGTHSTMRFEKINVWQAFKKIDEDNGLLGKDHDSYELSVY